MDSLEPGYSCPVDSILPVLTTEGNGGSAQVTGTFTQDNANQLAKTTANVTPIEGAIVFLLSLESGTVVGQYTTDASSQFTFNNIANGNYKISVRYNGIENDNVFNDIVISDDNDKSLLIKSDGQKITVSNDILAVSKPNTEDVNISPVPFAESLNI